MPLPFWDSEFGVNATVEMLFHKGAKIVRMVDRKQLTLPVEALVHMKYLQITEGE